MCSVEIIKLRNVQERKEKKKENMRPPEYIHIIRATQCDQLPTACALFM
jgi:hypothetical protein